MYVLNMQAHRQREFMEKKQNELVAKLSDAKLAAVKQQASVAHSVVVVLSHHSLRNNLELRKAKECVVHRIS